MWKKLLTRTRKTAYGSPAMFSHVPAAPFPRTTANRVAALFCALCLAVSGVVLARDADPTGERQYVLLDNENVLQGTVENRGPMIAVRDGDDEIRISSARVRCWAPSLEALYQYRVDHRFDSSAAALESDVEWCVQHGLYSLAAREIIALKTHHPEYPRIGLLETRLRAVAEQRSRSTTAGSNSKTSFKKSSVEDATHAEDDGDEPAVTVPASGSSKLLDIIEPQNVQQFTSAIQPILSNRCATGGCHGGVNAANPRMLRLQPNLHASGNERRQALETLLQSIDPSDPKSSKLLLYSVRSHADQKDPPLDATDDDLVDILQQWVTAIAQDLKTAAEQPGKDAVPSIAAAPADASETAGPPRRLPSIADPFDPKIFNNYYQPQPPRSPAR